MTLLIALDEPALIGCILTDSRSALLFLGSSRGDVFIAWLSSVWRYHPHALLLLGLALQANTFARQARLWRYRRHRVESPVHMVASVEQLWDANALEILTGPDEVRTKGCQT